MSRNKTEIIAGILLILMPFLGFPNSWKMVFYIIVGVLVIIYAFRSHFDRKSRPIPASSQQASSTFAEHNHPNALETGAETEQGGTIL